MTPPDRFCVLKESRNGGAWSLFKYESDIERSYWLYSGEEEGSKEELELRATATGTAVAKCGEYLLHGCMSAAEVSLNMEFG